MYNCTCLIEIDYSSCIVSKSKASTIDMDCFCAGRVLRVPDWIYPECKLLLGGLDIGLNMFSTNWLRVERIVDETCFQWIATADLYKLLPRTASKTISNVHNHCQLIGAWLKTGSKQTLNPYQQWEVKQFPRLQNALVSPTQRPWRAA